MLKIAKLARLALACTPFTWAQANSAAGTPVQMMVTVGHHYGHESLPALTVNDLTVTQVYEPLPVTNLISLRDGPAGLELFLLIDNSSNCEPSSTFEELRRFIGSQASTTAVGVAYIEGGRVQVAENPMQDHERAVKLLSAPTGSNPASPFGAVTELIQGWQQGSSRRAVLLISHGIDPAAADALQNPSAEAAIEAAQRAGVTVYAIYHPSADYLTNDSSKIRSGQVQLAHLAGETGGQAYFLDLAPLPSLTPFLGDIADHLRNQYLLEFLANPVEGADRLQEVTIKSKIPEVELMAPYRVWILGRRSGRSGVED
jgi:hypothetical protein